MDEVAKKNSPAGHRVFVKDYPKDDEQRAISIDKATGELLREHLVAYAVRDTEQLFTSTAGTALSRNNFRTNYWAPPVTAAKIPADSDVSQSARRPRLLAARRRR